MEDAGEYERVEFENVKTVAVLSGKGGVGKSTIAVQLAYHLKSVGNIVLLVDLDLSGPSVSKITGTEDQTVFSSEGRYYPVRKDNLNIFSMGSVDLEVEEFTSSGKFGIFTRIFNSTYCPKVDFVVIDTPPGLEDSHLFLNEFYGDRLSTLMVYLPDRLSLNSAKRQVAFCKKAGFKILGLIENMKFMNCECGCKYSLYEDANLAEYCKSVDLPYLGGIDYDVEMAKALDKGRMYTNPDVNRILSSLYPKGTQDIGGNCKNPD